MATVGGNGTGLALDHMLSRRVALVTGGGAGIGAAIAVRLAHGGCQVVVADVDEQAGRRTADRIGPERATALRADVSDQQDVAAMVEVSEQAFGGLDLLVNNAGGANEVSFPDAAPATWRRVIDVNLLGAMAATQAVLPAFRRRGGGAVVNIASIAGLGWAAHDAPEYAAAKAGLIRLTAALSRLGTEGIRVSCVCPDWVDTPASRATRARMTPQELTRVPPDILDPDAVAETAVRLLADPDSAGRVVELWCGEPARVLGAEATRPTVAGVLIAESLRVGSTLEDLSLRVTNVSRLDAGDVEAGQPRAWTLIHFEAPVEESENLAATLSKTLQRQGGWYCDFRSPDEIVVVFADQVFRYPRGDRRQRREVESYARSVGVPDAQLDWPE